MFKKESKLRDYVAVNLGKIDHQLSLISNEFKIKGTKETTGGQIDILAQDNTGHKVIIEIKKSDQTARETIQELIKYISLLSTSYSRQELRCIIISSEWKELLIPYSYFHSISDVDVKGYLVRQAGSSIKFDFVEPRKIHDMNFSPEIAIFSYESNEQRSKHFRRIQEKINALPFVKMAMIAIDGIGSPKIKSIACIWRISEDSDEGVKNIIDLSYLGPYAFPDWETESDALYFLTQKGFEDCFVSTTAEEYRGTPEKMLNLLDRFQISEVREIGNWKKDELTLFRDHKRIKDLLTAKNRRLPTESVNKYAFEDTISPSIEHSWKSGSKSFIDFLEGYTFWKKEVQRFLDLIYATRDEIDYIQIDMRDYSDLLYKIYQATEHKEAVPSYFLIKVLYKNGQSGFMFGGWKYSGKKIEMDVNEIMKLTHGSKGSFALFHLSSKIRDQRLFSYQLLGFEPFVIEVCPSGTKMESSTVYMEEGSSIQVDMADMWQPSRTLQSFIKVNSVFTNKLSIEIKNLGIPSSPDGDGPFFVVLSQGDF